MKKIVRTVTEYMCEVCRTRYKSIIVAHKCEARKTEERFFKKGDWVTNIEDRECAVVNWHYRFRGQIVRVLGPQAPDEEYEDKWLGGRGLDLHVFQFEVRFRCPCCQKMQTALYYSPELRRINWPR